jgi:hypothetical protein
MPGPAKVAVSITTTSDVMASAPPPPTPQLPQITLNGVALPTPSAYFPNGIQVVVFESFGDLTNPASIISNRANPIWPDPMTHGWWTTYRHAWDNVANQLMGSGNPEEQIVMIATYGMDVGMYPTQAWINTPAPSEGGQYIEYCANYVLIGNSAYGYDEGYEAFGLDHDQPVKTNVTATLTNP